MQKYISPRLHMWIVISSLCSGKTKRCYHELTCADTHSRQYHASQMVAGPRGRKLPVDLSRSRAWERDACKSIPASLHMRIVISSLAVVRQKWCYHELTCAVTHDNTVLLRGASDRHFALLTLLRLAALRESAMCLTDGGWSEREETAR